MKARHIFLATALVAASVSAGIYTHKPAPVVVKPTPTPIVDTTATDAPIGEPAIKSTNCVSQGGLPDSSCTKPIPNSAVNQSNIQSTICVSGYSKTVRPSASITNVWKKQSMKDYGITDPPNLIEYDHLWPIEDGGAPADKNQIWPQYLHFNIGGFDLGAKTKDSLENVVHKMICSNKMTLDEAKQCFGDWIKCYTTVVGTPPKAQ